MATILNFRHLHQATSKPENAELAEVQFWRKSMVRSTIVMAAIVVIGLGTLIFGEQQQLFDDDWGMWVLVITLFSVAGLTKVIMANIFFYFLLKEEAGAGRPGAPPPEPGLRTKAPRAIIQTKVKRPERRRIRVHRRAAARVQ
jgi:hypothetical protein